MSTASTEQSEGSLKNHRFSRAETWLIIPLMQWDSLFFRLELIASVCCLSVLQQGPSSPPHGLYDMKLWHGKQVTILCNPVDCIILSGPSPDYYYIIDRRLFIDSGSLLTSGSDLTYLLAWDLRIPATLQLRGEQTRAQPHEASVVVF